MKNSDHPYCPFKVGVTFEWVNNDFSKNHLVVRKCRVVDKVMGPISKELAETYGNLDLMKPCPFTQFVAQVGDLESGKFLTIPYIHANLEENFTYSISSHDVLVFQNPKKIFLELGN